MRFPSHLFRMQTVRSEPYMAAMAVVAAGMFVGAWVIGPAVSYDSADPSGEVSTERASYQEMIARPDPMPYRTATPSFDMPGPTNYAAAAKAKARDEMGERFADDERAQEAPRATRWSSRNYRGFDRHRVY